MKCDMKFLANMGDLDITEIVELPQDREYVLAFDQATGVTGMAVYDAMGHPWGYGWFKRMDGDKDVFRIELKRFIIALCKKYRVIGLIHEDVYGKTFAAMHDLFQIKPIFADIKNEYFPTMEVDEKNNQHWKKVFLYPEKVSQQGSAHEKRQVKVKVLSMYPELAGLPQDVYDAFGIAESYFNEKFGRVPDKILKEKKKTNQRVAIELEVNVFSSKDTARIVSTSLQNYARKYGIEWMDYDIEYSLDNNFRLAAESTPKLIAFIVPEHRDTGEICLKYNCPYAPAKVMVAFGKLKSMK